MKTKEIKNRVPIENGLFYSEFHKLVCEIKDYFEDNDIAIGTDDPAGMTNHEIAIICAWECFHKNAELSDIILSCKKRMSELEPGYKFFVS